MTQPTLRIATRESPLAMWQAEHVAALLGQQGHATQIVPLVSVGDTDMRPIAGTGQTGLFTKRIQQAVLDDDADLAVHSLKDLPTAPHPELSVIAVPGRGPVEDSLVTGSGESLANLPEDARVGTGSRRRAAQLKVLRPDLEILPIRGNVQTRLSKLASGEFDAIILAKAGLERLEMTEVKRVDFCVSEMLPAPGQGALGIECRSDDVATVTALQTIDHQPTHASVMVERKLLAKLQGGCLAPIAAHASVSFNADGGLQDIDFTARVISVDGTQQLEFVLDTDWKHRMP
ncbi:MAG: hydroxymethylbilane synthase, partial [Planctomycetota bacterium]